MPNKLIVGLGNPDSKYQNTRHNIGELAVEGLALLGSKGGVWEEKQRLFSWVNLGKGVIFAKTDTYMNDSGKAVSKLVNYYKIDLKDLYIIHDDVDLGFLKYKIQFDVSSAGHHGVEDIIQKLGSQQFWRVRIGAGRPDEDSFNVENWVLSKIGEDDLQKIGVLSEEIFHKIL